MLLTIRLKQRGKGLTSILRNCGFKIQHKDSPICTFQISIRGKSHSIKALTIWDPFFIHLHELRFLLLVRKYLNTQLYTNAS